APTNPWPNDRRRRATAGLFRRPFLPPARHIWKEQLMTDNKDQIAATKSLTGYKHPPTKTRFQKGHSGNPRGRPKESRNLVTVLSEALNQSVTLKQDGKSRQVTKGDALIDVLLNMASKGERRAVDAVINLIG